MSANRFHPDTDIPGLFQQRWASRMHLGPARPTIIVEIQKGYFKHGQKRWHGDDVGAAIPGEAKDMPFRAYWINTTPWIQMPGVARWHDQQDFTNNGMKVGTLTLENVGMNQYPGVDGNIFTVIQPGFMSPYNYYNAPNRPKKTRYTVNLWSNALARKARIRVWQGYGEPEFNDDKTMPNDGGSNGAWTFNGLVDDVDISAAPARIEITARMGSKVTDQRLFGWAKSRTVLDPVTFADRQDVKDAQDDITTVSTPGLASSSRAGYPVRYVCDINHKTAWESNAASGPAWTEWVEIRIPAGRYSEFVLQPQFEGMEIYVGIYLKARKGGKAPLVDGKQHEPGWMYMGKGIVPGQNGGWPYVRKMPTHSANLFIHKLGFEITTGDASIIRVGFRKLHKMNAHQYRAGCRRLAARKRVKKKTSDAKTDGQLILVDDVSEIVKVVLRWAGYEEWQIERTGTRVKGKFVLNRSNFHIDAIKKACEQTGFVFYVDDPSSGESHGVPIFRRNSAVESYDNIQEVRDVNMLTGIKMKVTEEPLAYNIRIRGNTSGSGKTLGGDKVKRIMYYYKPPWARQNVLSGVLKHVTATYPDLRTLEECKVAAHLTALEQALQSVTGVIEIPGHPFFRLDSQIGVLDNAVGVNSRMWISNRESDHTLGEHGKWITTLSGSFIDTPNVIDVIADINANTKILK